MIFLTCETVTSELNDSEMSRSCGEIYSHYFLLPLPQFFPLSSCWICVRRRWRPPNNKQQLTLTQSLILQIVAARNFALVHAMMLHARSHLGLHDGPNTRAKSLPLSFTQINKTSYKFHWTPTSCIGFVVGGFFTDSFFIFGATQPNDQCKSTRSNALTQLSHRYLELPIDLIDG